MDEETISEEFGLKNIDELKARKGLCNSKLY